MPSDKRHLNIAVIQKMILQIGEIKADIERRIDENNLSTSPAVSTGSLRKALRDISAQYDALTFARDELTRIYGSAPAIIDGGIQRSNDPKDKIPGEGAPAHNVDG